MSNINKEDTSQNEQKQENKEINIIHKVVLGIVVLVLFITLLTPKDSSTNTGAKEVVFSNKLFTTFLLDESNESLKLYWEDVQNTPLKSIGALKKKVEKEGEELLFAMNAGMFTPNNEPQGLYVANYKEQTPIDDKPKGYGNFYMMPNGVFAFDENEAIVQERQAFLKAKKKYKYATQSGPMLVIDGELHPAFQKDSKSVHIRNGVGITEDGEIVFAISEDRVNLYTFATLFRDHFNCPNALYLDGAISKAYLPELGKRELSGNLGPLVGLTKSSKKQKQRHRSYEIQSGQFSFKETSFDVYLYSLNTDDIQFYLKDKYGYSYKGIPELKRELDQSGKKLVFAMNGGSFTQYLQPEGLLINNGKELATLNLEKGEGNFYLQPNGIFAITDNAFRIEESTSVKNIKETINFATQSGPLLLKNGKIHPKLTKGSKNLNIRNGVGLINSQQVAFVISKEPVNFYDFASFFREVLNCNDALYLDGVNSIMYAPELGRNRLEHKKKLGPIIAIVEEK